MRAIRREDKCGEVAGLRVERAIGIQGLPLLICQTAWLNLTSLSLGNSEKSRDPPSALLSESTPGVLSVLVPRVPESTGREGMVLTAENDVEGQLHDNLVTRFYQPD